MKRAKSGLRNLKFNSKSEYIKVTYYINKFKPFLILIYQTIVYVLFMGFLFTVITHKEVHIWRQIWTSPISRQAMGNFLVILFIRIIELCSYTKCFKNLVFLGGMIQIIKFSYKWQTFVSLEVRFFCSNILTPKECFRSWKKICCFPLFFSFNV